ncbi:MAG: DNA internalization-related competence protein ComEC/Rec2 [Thermodesulfobacteriota bacterium]|nr:MAG: DNA internalization-related competence protein ComEC/Rec2 [Thermodesulfobacteriota bacterium]
MYPLAPLFFSFAAGIYVASKLPLSPGAVYLLVFLSFVPAIILYVSRFRFNAMAVAPVFFFTGALFITPYVTPDIPANHVRMYVEKGSREGTPPARAGLYSVTAVVSDTPRFKDNSARFVVEAKKIFYDGRWRDTTGKIRLKVRGSPRGLYKGDYIRFLAFLREPENFGNPGEFDYVSWLRQRSIEVTGIVREGPFVVKLKEAGPGFSRYMEDLRRGVGGFIDASGVKHPAILKALITGDRTGLDRGTKEAYIRSGTVHLLAISGLHIGLASYFSYLLISFLLKRSTRLTLALNVKKTALVFSLFPVFGYAALAGFSLPTIRAALMAAVFIIAFIFDRGRSYYNTLAAAALVILVIEPFALWDASFQLSFTVVFFILYLYPRFYALFKIDGVAEVPVPDAGERVKGFVLKRLKGPLQVALVTLAASIGAYPLVAYHFQRVSAAGLASNLIAVPLTAVIIPLLFLSSLLIPVSKSLAVFFLHGADMVLSLQVLVVNFFSGLSFSSVWVSRPTVIEVFLMYGLILTLPWISRGRVFKIVTAFLVFFLVLDQGYWMAEKKWNKDLRVTFLSVGQGDSALIELPGGATMLIDGGGFYSKAFDTGERIVAPVLRYKRIKKIDYMVLSHSQRDHREGLKFIAANFKVGEFWWNGFGSLGRLSGILENRGVRIKVLGEKREVLTVNGARVEVMPTGGRAGLDMNDRSLVVRVSYGKESFYLPGDIGRAAEAELIKTPFRADVLKSPHHGSGSSSSAGFIRMLGPSVVVVSAGRDNPFGFPHAGPLAAYRAAGARIFRTDLSGAVEVTTDGKGLDVRTFGGTGRKRHP